MSFTFGPVQTMFLEALESGEHKQVFGHFQWGDGTCALGLANKVCKLGENENHVFLHDTYKKLGLRSSMGICVDVNSVGEEVIAGPSIGILNDDMKLSFPEIAKCLRTYPQQYFAFSI